LANLLLTVDVEDWFHLGGGGGDNLFKTPVGSVESWGSYQPRVVDNVLWILDLLDRHQMKGTFFVLGWVADAHPQLIREIDRRGHEVASHGYSHKFVTQQQPSEFRGDLRRSIQSIQDLTGRKILGYRAPYASITEWALDILGEEGLLYDSSYYPATYHDMYGKIPGLEKSSPIERLPNGLWEVRMSSLFVGKIALPWGGGGYFRMIPYPIFRQGILQILRRHGLYQFYIHPWELDPDAPHLDGLKMLSCLRRYVGLRSTRKRLERLITEFRFITIEEALVAREAGVGGANIDQRLLAECTPA
jgi:polysaccharide deacetylase family protein (PEP-CTERM system associated)